MEDKNNEDDLPVFWRKLEFQHSRYNKNNKAFFKENDTLCERIARFFYYIFH